MSNSISKESRFKWGFLGIKKFQKTSNSNKRFRAYYTPSIVILLVLGCSFQFFGADQLKDDKVSVDKYNKAISEGNFQKKYLEEKALILMKSNDSIINLKQNKEKEIQMFKNTIDSLENELSKKSIPNKPK